MKVIGRMALIGSLFATVGSAAAHDADLVGIDPPSAAASMALPTGVTLREIIRMYRSKTQTHSTNFYWPENGHKQGWRLEGTLGFLSSTPFQDSTPLYSCNGPGNWNYFTSPDPDCEAGYHVGDYFIGHISKVALPGTLPLYRCVFIWKGTDWRHFDTLDPTCEGSVSAVNDGVLGHVFL